VLYVDTSASAEQRRVVTKLIVEQAGRNIGKIVATKDVPVTFNQTETGTVFEAGKAVTLSVREIPGRPCCVMPHNVWYKPLVKLDRPLVGTTVKNRVKETALNATWLRTEESSAFYGTFTLPATEKVTSTYCLRSPIPPSRLFRCALRLRDSLSPYRDSSPSRSLPPPANRLVRPG